MLEDIAEIGGKIDFCSRAGSINTSQHVENSATISRFPELRAGEHAFFDAQCPLDSIVGVLKIRISEIQREFIKVFNEISTGRVQFCGRRPDLRGAILTVGRSTQNISCRSGNAAIFQRLPHPSGVTAAQLQYLSLIHI